MSGAMKGMVWTVVVLLGALAAPPAEAQAPDAIRWEPFEWNVGGEVVDTVELGRLEVPERRGVEGAGVVDLAFVRLPSRSAEPGPPIVYLDGGPGGDGIGIASVPGYHRLFDRLREVADVILLSQRGTGRSTPRLLCRLAEPLPHDVFTTRERMLEALDPSVEACAESWRGRGVDLAGYNTVESAHDLDALRRALGAERISLLGFSYGTHLGLAALRSHGERIGRAVFLGTEGLEHTWKLPSTPDLQIRHVARLAAADPSTAEAVPDLHAALDTLLARLDREPISVPIRTADGEGAEVLLGGDGMRYLIQRDVGDTNDLPLLPAAVRMTLDGDVRPLSALVGRRFGEIAGVPLMTILMDCASGASEERLARIRREEPSSLTGAMTNTWFPEVCARVPEADLGNGFRERFVSDVPTLFLSGTLDANTPPYQARYVSWGWPRATHLIVEGAGHETLMPHPAAQDVIADFFRGEDVSGRRIDLAGPDFLSPAEVGRIFGGR